MKKLFTLYAMLLSFAMLYGQAGHIMQGIGAVNMSMGGAATAQPLDISGALHWNPATISSFDNRIIKLDVGLFFSSPELSSSMTMPDGSVVSGTTADDRGVSPMPALAMVWGSEESKHTFGISAFGISGFGVTFPEEANNPMSPNFNPLENSNVLNWPQQAGGFGRIESDYMLLQVGLTYAYEISENFSIGVQPTFNWASLELQPNPTADPTQAGYADQSDASALGIGGQIGLYYTTDFGLKVGAAYKTQQYFQDLEFDNTYLDGTQTTSEFRMNYPSIISVGLGYSTGDFDFALDYRFVDYANTDGFSETGWKTTGAVEGFGWESISVISAGLQYSGINRLPLRVGYTYSTNPINEDVVFFNVPATAIIKHAFQFGLTYEVNDRFGIDAAYHHGTSAGKTEGQMLNPQMIEQGGGPYGKVPGSSVAYEMTTDLITVGLSFRLNK